MFRRYTTRVPILRFARTHYKFYSTLGTKTREERQAMLRDGKYKEVLEEGLATLKKTPKAVYVIHDVAAAYMRLNRYEESLNYISQAIELDPTDDISVEAKASMLWALGRHDECTSFTDAAISKFPNNKPLKLLKSMILVKKGEKEAAEALEIETLLDESVERDFYDLMTSGIGLKQKNNPKYNATVRKVLNRALDMMPAGSESKDIDYSFKAMAYDSLEQFDKAYAYYEEFLKRQPNDESSLRRHLQIMSMYAYTLPAAEVVLKRFDTLLANKELSTKFKEELLIGKRQVENQVKSNKPSS